MKVYDAGLAVGSMTFTVLSPRSGPAVRKERRQGKELWTLQPKKIRRISHCCLDYQLEIRCKLEESKCFKTA